ncbi:DNA polymerase Y family protein [Methylomonas sp. SURF-2]|uniref:DNA polymerase Y family protein n=1 Tax=Methylomonas subterranea TaxID=2952225 RepID=A0ABT1TKN3_9GAMM|nr:DNA polymerase Y family protein [Methylomonas sp. SURF-2]MCQ8106034.1 DNA polymerase Y family protein [Methylomonas sp. SURF-2]
MSAALASVLTPDSFPSPPIEPAVSSRRPKLWLCAYFPELALTAAGLDLQQAVALQVQHKGRPSLYAVSVPARQAGVEAGMASAAALALCPGLQIRDRDMQLERIALSALADAALTFSPWISLDCRNALLLEVGSCLTLFGGVENLRKQLCRVLLGSGHSPVIALAPSPAAAELLARLNIEISVQQSAELHSLLGPVPLNRLDWDTGLLKRLSRTGVQTLADLWRLPRDGLARRYGVGLLHRLDALAGNDNRILGQFHRPPRFAASRELPTELEKLEHFFPAVEQLAAELADFLRQRDAAALGVRLLLSHFRRPASCIELSFRSPSRNAGHCCRLLREKLERSALPAPVLNVELVCEAIAPFQPQTFSLFDDEQQREHDWQTALEQLQDRLGHQALQYPATAAEHRPERAGTLAYAPHAADAPRPTRPLRLLAEPEPLDPATLTYLPDKERIESGWWDGAALRRDYRIAHDRSGRKLWVFRDLKPGGGWYCHGLFG